MRNFQGIVFIWAQTYKGDFQICVSVPLIRDKFFQVRVRYSEV